MGNKDILCIITLIPKKLWFMDWNNNLAQNSYIYASQIWYEKHLSSFFTVSISCYTLKPFKKAQKLTQWQSNISHCLSNLNSILSVSHFSLTPSPSLSLSISLSLLSFSLYLTHFLNMTDSREQTNQIFSFRFLFLS